MSSSRMTSEALVEWAKALGFPGADKPEFKANVGKLITPPNKMMWRHLIKHVRPADEVAHVRKQILHYKQRNLCLENNPPENSLQHFDSVADYEAFLKKGALEAKMEYCNALVGKKQEDLKKISIKLEEKGEWHQSQKMEEKDKMEKLRLLRAKRQELESHVDSFKQMIPLFDSFMRPEYSHRNNSTMDSWELEVQKYVASLERGQEIAMMCHHLRAALKTDCKHINLKDIADVDEELKFQNFTMEYLSSLGLKLLELDEKYNYMLEQLKAKRQDVISTMESSGDVVLSARGGLFKKVIESGRLEVIGKAAERTFIVQWLRNNKTGFDISLNATCVDEREKLAELEQSITKVQEDIAFFTSFPSSRLESRLAGIVTKIKAEATAACTKEDTSAAVVDEILSDLPRLIELFIKTPVTMKKVDPGTHSMQAFADLKFKLLKTTTAKAVTSVDVAVREQIPDSNAMIKHVQSKVSRENSKTGQKFDNLSELLQVIDQILQYNNVHLECWEKTFLTEVIFNYPDYQDLLKRLKNAPE